MRWINAGKLNGLHPKLFARPSVEAVQVSLLARVFRTSDKDAPMRNDGAAVTRTWECRFPSDVIRRPPMEGRFVLFSDTIPERPAELRPIRCPPCNRQQQGKSSRLKKYSAIHVQGEAPESGDSSCDCEAKRIPRANPLRKSLGSKSRLSAFCTYPRKFLVASDGWRHVVLFTRGHVAAGFHSASRHQLLITRKPAKPNSRKSRQTS